MKKLISVLLVIMMLLSLAACAKNGGEPENTQEAVNTHAAETEEVKPTEAAETEPAETEPAETEPAPTEAMPAEPPQMIEIPERPAIAQLEGGNYSIHYGDKLETWSTVYYLTEDGRLFAYGDNRYYQLGLGNNEMNPEAVLVMESVKAINGEGCRLFALKEDGTLWTWGVYSRWANSDESYGFTEPTQILDNVAEFDGGFALTAGGELYSTENGENGAVVPLKIAENIASFSDSGSLDVAAVTNEGEMLTYYGGVVSNPDGSVTPAWENAYKKASGVKQSFEGGNYYTDENDVLYGFIWNGEEVVPAEITDNVYRVCPRRDETGSLCVIKYDGSLWRCKGADDGAFSTEKLLDDVVYFISENYVDEDFGVRYSLALNGSGELYGWGPNWYGELGGVDPEEVVGATSDTPMMMTDDVKMVWSDGVNTYIIRGDNSLWGTGYNGAKYSRWEESGGIGLDPDEGRLGNGTNETLMDGWFTFDRIAENAACIYQRLAWVFTVYEDDTDSTHTFARVFMVDTEGSLWAWSYNKDGCLMRRGEAYLLSPVKIIDVGDWAER